MTIERKPFLDDEESLSPADYDHAQAKITENEDLIQSLVPITGTQDVINKLRSDNAYQHYLLAMKYVFLHNHKYAYSKDMYPLYGNYKDTLEANLSKAVSAEPPIPDAQYQLALFCLLSPQLFEPDFCGIKEADRRTKGLELIQALAASNHIKAKFLWAFILEHQLFDQSPTSKNQVDNLYAEIVADKGYEYLPRYLERTYPQEFSHLKKILDALIGKGGKAATKLPAQDIGDLCEKLMFRLLGMDILQNPTTSFKDLGIKYSIYYSTDRDGFYLYHSIAHYHQAKEILKWVIFPKLDEMEKAALKELKALNALAASPEATAAAEATASAAPAEPAPSAADSTAAPTATATPETASEQYSKLLNELLNPENGSFKLLNIHRYRGNFSDMGKLPDTKTIQTLRVQLWKWELLRKLQSNDVNALLPQKANKYTKNRALEAIAQIINDPNIKPEVKAGIKLLVNNKASWLHKVLGEHRTPDWLRFNKQALTRSIVKASQLVEKIEDEDHRTDAGLSAPGAR